MECRNRIVAKYMENPEKRLTVSDCQGLVVSIDIEDLTRIFRFLDHWGIINYCAAPPSCESWSGGSYLREDPNGEVHVPSASLKSIDSLIQFDKPRCRLKAADVYSSFSCHGDDFSDLDNRIRECLSENCCNCCSQPLPSVFYQSQKEVNPHFLCPYFCLLPASVCHCYVVLSILDFPFAPCKLFLLRLNFEISKVIHIHIGSKPGNSFGNLQSTWNPDLSSLSLALLFFFLLIRYCWSASNLTGWYTTMLWLLPWGEICDWSFKLRFC